jgi:release factor glutamine methyltransferase
MLARATEFLAKKGIEAARREAEVLVGHALGFERLGLFLALDRPLERDEVERARSLLVRRARHEPSAYLTGKREFYGREFRVGPGVLVPRPETELLVDCARTLARGRQALRVADVGTGSGCLAATLALELEQSRVTAVELSPAALAFARQNAAALATAIEFVQGDGLAVLAGPFDLVVSNPPYVDPEERALLAPEVREHEPPEALFAPAGAPDHWVERLLAESVGRIAPGGHLLVELGHRQGARATAWRGLYGLPWRLVRDYERCERVLEVGPWP